MKVQESRRTKNRTIACSQGFLQRHTLIKSGNGNLHAVDEWIDIDSMVTYFRICETYIVRRLGVGGFAEVWEVERSTDGRRLALKVLSEPRQPVV